MALVRADPAIAGGFLAMNRAIEERITAFAAAQHGLVTRAQLIESGLSEWAVIRRLRSGRLRQVHRGVYLAAPLMLPRSREMAAVLTSGTAGLVSHFSAVGMWGLISPPAESQPVDLTVVGANCGRRPGIRVHRVSHLEPADYALIDGVPVTSVPRTVADIAGVLGSRELERVVARAQREGLVMIEALFALTGRMVRRPGVATLRAVLNAQGGPALTRSEAEARFLMLVRRASLPPPETNVRFGIYEIDFLWRAEAIAVEIDGFRHHSSKPRFESDRRKDAWLLANGIKVVRLSWQQIAKDPVSTIVQVGQALALARRERGLDRPFPPNTLTSDNNESHVVEA